VEVADAHRRLDGFWGAVDHRYNELIARHVKGPRSLDLGSGYGTLVGHLDSLPGVSAVGADSSDADTAIARELNQGARFEIAPADRLPFGDGEFDTIVMRDALHHLWEETDWNSVSAEVRRVTSPSARLVILDPNPTLLVRAARAFVRHQDAVCDYPTARMLVEGAGFEIVRSSFHTLFTLPLSGGYVGPRLVPSWPWLGRALLGAEELTERVVNRLGLGRAIAWRYLIVADRVAR